MSNEEGSTNDNAQLPDPFEMSDEAFLEQEGQFHASEGATDLAPEGDQKQNSGDADLEDNDGDTNGDADPNNGDGANPDEDGDKSDDADPNGDGTDASDSDPDDNANDDGNDGGTDDSDDGEKDSDSDDVNANAKTFFEKVTAPFKANGREMQIKDPDDAIRLMQMGANYNRKMAGMKPHLKHLKTLEKAKLLDEEKLNFLIDLNNKDPKAIARLVKDAGIDPLEMNLEEGDGYEASQHGIDDQELALDEVLDDIRDTETYAKTLDVVSKQWDEKSRKTVAKAPQLMQIINDHMANGVYDVISTAVERERTLGRLGGMSDIEAYRAIGDKIDSEGGFDHLFKKEQRQQDTPNRHKPKEKAGDKARRAARRAASPNRSASDDAGDSADYNPLAMSDEAFMKQTDDRFL